MDFDQLRTQHNLPELSFFKQEFELKGDEEHIARELRKKMSGLLDSYISLLEEIIHPDGSNPRSIHEANYFTPEKRIELTIFYKNLMQLYRKATRAAISRKEDDDIAFILATLADWEDIKRQMLSVVTVLEKSWNGSTLVEEEVAYLG